MRSQVTSPHLGAPSTLVGAALDSTGEPDLSLPRGAAWLEAGGARSLVLLVVLMLSLNIAVSFPGTMMNDSVNQYAEAVSGRFTDWHPPIMAWLWSQLRALADGPGPLLVLHLVVYWTGILLIADAARRLGMRRIAVLVALSGAFPPFVFLNANVIKDVGMAVSLLTGTALVFWWRSQGRRIPLAWACVAAALLIYGVLVRTNAVFAIGPLVLFAYAPARWLRSFRLVVASVLIAVAAVPITTQLNRLLFEPVERESVNSLFLYDLIGIAAHEGDPSLVQPRANLQMQDIRRCYTPFWWDSFSSWGPCGPLVQRPDPERATEGKGLAKQWLRTIAEHPTAYMTHRLKHFNSEVMFAVPLKHLRLTPEYRGDDPSFKPLEVFSPANIRFDLVRKNPSTWPVTWLVWGVVLFAFLARRTPTTSVLLARALVVSALGYSLAYLVVGVATDFRYHYWSMLATLLATLLVLPQVARGWRRGVAVLRGGVGVLALVVAAGVLARLMDFQAWVF